MVLVASYEFASSNAAPSGVMFYQPGLFSKWQSAHGCGASLPVDGRDEFGCKTRCAVPILLRTIHKGEGVELFLVRF
jgi:hypothetical protein